MSGSLMHCKISSCICILGTPYEQLCPASWRNVNSVLSYCGYLRHLSDRRPEKVGRKGQASVEKFHKEGRRKGQLLGDWQGSGGSFGQFSYWNEILVREKADA
jgi:hypothetical protein